MKKIINKDGFFVLDFYDNFLFLFPNYFDKIINRDHNLNYINIYFNLTDLSFRIIELSFVFFL